MILTTIWHRFWFKYNLELYESCIDKEIKLQLLRKAQYHERRLNFS
ncbi:hypothetical protein [Paenibacillus aceris]|uniref:Uncharacterized protein n=1 Tax=Paenibacillus aceris TaxID=869555 RepID=A0ABS4HUJ1_9BACL|nr:hypothetical protein [Paenibacillus aceris]MBP1962302.1 hypothetical protein [Paenibacillus aceris]NHW37125.1 hypothetical protein [Paenibacillus aceris]